MNGAADGIVRLAVTGRATGEAVEGLRASLEEALSGRRPFAVLFDRSRMTALTPEGRAALERWDAELTPRLPAWCVAWADVYDERRARSLQRGRDGRGRSAEAPYPQEIFDTATLAERWLRGWLPWGGVALRAR